MAREIVQRAIIKVIQPQIVRYTCDRCGQVCGTRENRKKTWYGSGVEFHYCEKTCQPSDHPIWVKDHVLNCASCYKRAEGRGDTWMYEAVLASLAGP